MPADWRAALTELAAAASSGRTFPAQVVALLPRSVEEVDVDTAAERLGIGRRAVQARCARGTLPCRRVGRSWLIEWKDETA